MKTRILVSVLASCLAICASSQTVIDVMVAFDGSAAAWAANNGKETSALAQAAVEQMNSVLPATGLDESFGFRLVGTFLSSASADPSLVGQERLADVLTSVSSASRGTATGAWKDIQSARDQYKADLVVVLADTGLDTSSGLMVGGVSWTMGSTKLAKLTDFAKWAYCVCGVQEVERGYIVIHEVGHLMGAGHSDRLEEAPGPQLYAYSSAWHVCDTYEQKYYTVMGYPYLSETDYGYMPYPAFSSSTHTMEDGTPLGDATHDNTRTLRETCTSVAQFRISGNEGPAAAFAAKTTVNGCVRDEAGALSGLVQITVAKTDKKGLSKVSAAYYGMDGKKKSVKAAKSSVVLIDNVPTIRDLPLTVKGIPEPLLVTVGADGSIVGSLGSRMVATAGSIAALPTTKPRFVLDASPAEIGGFPSLRDVRYGDADYHLLPDGDGVSFSVNGKKWVFAKAASVKYIKDKELNRKVLVVDTGKSGEKSNLCGLKLSVNTKTGVFKGSFTAYADAGTADQPKLKKFKFTVTGLLADGYGVGQAVCKKDGPYPVSLR